mmetsp:Transcript_38137/g.70576  ORF Transcript_38137/g.70576 Transcript_38137/m.70576 type:complete len:101 (+) Transcript_38137:25-327(+)
MTVMHDVAPIVFPDQDAVYMRCLLNGLVSHSRNHSGPRVQVTKIDSEKQCVFLNKIDSEKHCVVLKEMTMVMKLHCLCGPSSRSTTFSKMNTVDTMSVGN